MHLTSIFFMFLLQGILGVLASLYPHEATDLVEISQTLNLFGVLADTAQYSEMGRVFTTNPSLDFDLPGVRILHGLTAVQKGNPIISNVTSQHSLMTCHVGFLGPRAANATASIVGTFVGPGPQAGQTFIVYGTSVKYAAHVEAGVVPRVARYHMEMLLFDVGWRVNTLTLTQTVSQN